MEQDYSDFAEIVGNLRKCIESINEITDKFGDEYVRKNEYIIEVKHNLDIMTWCVDNLSCNCKEIRERGTFFKTNIIDGNLKLKDTKVLVVDDNDINNYFMKDMLKRFDIDVDIAKGGEQAIELFKNNEYDMILMDYLMPPGIDGIETVKRIRDVGERGRKQLIIGLSVNVDNTFKRGLNSHNVELIITKPVNYNQMAVILRNELSDKIFH